MPLDTHREYLPKLDLPVYIRITSEGYNNMKVGEVYDVAVRKEGEDRYYDHEAMLIAVSTADDLDDIPDVVKAFDQQTRDRDTAIERLKRYDEESDDIWVAVFMRLDVAKEFIVEGELET